MKYSEFYQQNPNRGLEIKKKKTSRPQKFAEDEMLLIDAIKEADKITLSKLYCQTKLKKSYINQLLILFITWDLVQISISEEGTFYSLANVEEVVED